MENIYDERQKTEKQKLLVYALIEQTILRRNGSFDAFVQSIIDKLQERLSKEELESVIRSINVENATEAAVSSLGVEMKYSGARDCCSGKYYSFRQHKFIPVSAYSNSIGLLSLRACSIKQVDSSLEDYRRQAKEMPPESVEQLLKQFDSGYSSCAGNALENV